MFNAVLGLVDIKRGSNSYYKLQLLEGDNAKNYQLFRSWGRVGTTIGGNKLEVSLPILSQLLYFTSCASLLLELWGIQGSCKGQFRSSLPGEDGEQLGRSRRHVCEKAKQVLSSGD